MKAFQQAFIEFAIARGVLKFGEFTLKSGRKSPYFFKSLTEAQLISDKHKIDDNNFFI